MKSLQEYIVEARGKAQEDYAHRCTCDFTSRVGEEYHEQQMRIMIAKMQEYEQEAINKYYSDLENQPEEPIVQKPKKQDNKHVRNNSKSSTTMV